MELKVGSVCDRGLNPKRPVNQDRCLALPSRGLFAVFDGVGGQRAGEVASQTAAETIEEALAHIRDDSPTELIRRAIRFANRDIHEMAESDPAYKTMATTVALVHLDGDRATIAHVGDSRVYRLEDGRFYRETIDHTDLNDDLRAGLVRTDQAADRHGRNVINRALGVEPDVDVEIKSITVRDGTRLLLCSDGIYRHMEDEEIACVLAENKDPQRAADELKRIVHERGAEDNLTAVVVQVGRARQSQVLAVETAMPDVTSKTTLSAAGQGSFAAKAPNPRGVGERGRIQVEFGGPAERREYERAHKSNFSGPAEWAGRREPASRKIIYALVALLVISAAFYAGLRASDLIKKQPSDPIAPGPIVAGLAALDSGDYQAAAAQFSLAVEREPQSAEAHYYLGRAQLELREYAKAAQSFEKAVSLPPTTKPVEGRRLAIHDAYVQAAAAYAALGDRAKAQQMLARYGEERRRLEQPAQNPGR